MKTNLVVLIVVAGVVTLLGLCPRPDRPSKNYGMTFSVIVPGGAVTYDGLVFRVVEVNDGRATITVVPIGNLKSPSAEEHVVDIPGSFRHGGLEFWVVGVKDDIARIMVKKTVHKLPNPQYVI